MSKPGTPVVSIVYERGGGHTGICATHVYERGNSYWLYDMDYQPEVGQEGPPGLVAVMPIAAVTSIHSQAGIIRGMPPAGSYQPRAKANKEPEAE